MNNPPEFEAEIEHVAGQPSLVSLRLIHHGGANASDHRRRGAIVGALRTAVINAVRPWFPNRSRRFIQDHVRGWLQASNITNNNIRVSNVQMHLADVTNLAIQNLVALIQESNAEIGLLDLRWSFVINPNSLVVGGAHKVTKPSYAGKLFSDTWAPQVYNGTPLNCAAYSISYSTTLRAHKRKEYVKRVAFNLMEQFQWYIFILS